MAPELGPAEDLAFTADYDGTVQRYVLRRPAGAPRGLLVALHGHGSDRWQYARDPRDECRAARDAAARDGLLFVAPDYRAATSWMGPAAEADVRQLIALVGAPFGFTRAVLVGGSMGGTAALTFAVRHPALVAGVCAQNPHANFVEFEGFPEAIAASFGGTKADCPDVYADRSAELHPDALTMPVALTTGGADTVVPPHSARRLAAALRARGRDVLLIHRDAGGHATDYTDTWQALTFVLDRAK
jgi:pimeloyl-ACP methyl ester carboxylesterase